MEKAPTPQDCQCGLEPYGQFPVPSLAVGLWKRVLKGGFVGLPVWGPQSAGRVRDAIPSFVLSQGKRGEIKDFKDFKDIKDAPCESRV